MSKWSWLRVALQLSAHLLTEQSGNRALHFLLSSAMLRPLPISASRGKRTASRLGGRLRESGFNVWRDCVDVACGWFSLARRSACPCSCMCRVNGWSLHVQCTYRNVSLQSDNTNPFMLPIYMHVSVNMSFMDFTKHDQKQIDVLEQ